MVTKPTQSEVAISHIRGPRSKERLSTLWSDEPTLFYATSYASKSWATEWRRRTNEYSGNKMYTLYTWVDLRDKLNRRGQTDRQFREYSKLEGPTPPFPPFKSQSRTQGSPTGAAILHDFCFILQSQASELVKRLLPLSLRLSLLAIDFIFSKLSCMKGKGSGFTSMSSRTLGRNGFGGPN
jgi:hypothetical protein